MEKRETEVVETTSWFQELRSEAWTEYGNLSWPSRKDEDWRFGSPAEAVLTSEEIAEGGTKTVAATTPVADVEHTLKLPFNLGLVPKGFCPNFKTHGKVPWSRAGETQPYHGGMKSACCLRWLFACDFLKSFCEAACM